MNKYTFLALNAFVCSFVRFCEIGELGVAELVPVIVEKKISTVGG
jgi:hypothetical protein